MYEENGPPKPRGRRQFEGQSAMTRINADYAPGSTADGGGELSRPSRKQFPEQTAYAKIRRPTQRSGSNANANQNHTTGRRPVRPEHESNKVDASMASLLSDVYVGMNVSNEAGPRMGRRASRENAHSGSSSYPYATTENNLTIETEGCGHQSAQQEAPKSPAERIKAHRGTAPWEHDAGSGIGHNPRRRSHIVLQGGTNNARARALKGLPKKAGSSKSAAAVKASQGPSSPLSTFMAAQGHAHAH